MNFSSFLSKYLYHIIAIVAFIALSALFNTPALQGDKLNSHDYFTWAYGAQETIDYYKKTGENPQWSNAQFGGMPSVMIDYYAESNIFQRVWHKLMGYKIGQPFNPFYFFFWAMLSFYLLSQALRIKPIIGILGAIIFGFASYHPIIIAAGHNTKMVDLAFLPGITAGIVWAYRGNYIKGAAIAGVFLAFFLDAGHYQIIFYGGIFCLLFALGFLVDALKTKTLKNWTIASLSLFAIVVLGFLSSSSRIIQTLDYNEFSMRGGNSVLSEETNGGLDKSYAFQWSNGLGETYSMFIPNIFGAASSYDLGSNSNYAEALNKLGVPYNQAQSLSSTAPTYWGPQPSLSGPMYMGAFLFILTVLGLFSIKSQIKWWILAGGILCLLFSFGDNLDWFNYFLFDNVPMFNKFRSPNMAMTITGFALAIIAIWGLHSFFLEKNKELQWKHLKYTGIISIAFFALTLLNIAFIYSFTGTADAGIQQQFSQAFGEQGTQSVLNALRKDRQSLAWSSWFQSLLFTALTFAALWAFYKGKIKEKIGIIVLIIIALIDLIPTGKKYLNENNYMDAYTFQQLFKPSDLDKAIQEDPDLYYRVYDVRQSPFNDSKASAFHKSIGGYHPAKMQAYQDLISAHIGKFNGAVLSMLNTKYIISRNNEGQEIYQINPNALGNAWFVEKSKIVNNRKEALNALEAAPLGSPQSDSDFQPEKEVVITEDFAQKLKSTQWNLSDDDNASIILKSYKPNELIFTSKNENDGFAVFSDIYYPKGWVAKIDNKEVEIHEVNFLLRGLEIPAGEHTISFYFEAPSYEKGERLGFIGSIGLTLLLIVAAVQNFIIWNKKKTAK